jgi:hypothetical protein
MIVPIVILGRVIHASDRRRRGCPGFAVSRDIR